MPPLLKSPGEGESGDANYSNSNIRTNFENKLREFKFDNSMTDDHSHQPTSTYRSEINASFVKHDDLKNQQQQPSSSSSSLYQFEWPNMEDLSEIFSNLCSVAVIFGGLAPYVPQYIKVKQLENCDGFSTYGM